MTLVLKRTTGFSTLVETLGFIAHIHLKELRKILSAIQQKEVTLQTESKALLSLIFREEDSAMVFVSNEIGEHSITTRDLSVNENTIIQFEVLALRKLFCLLLLVLPYSALVYLPSCSDCQIEKPG